MVWVAERVPQSVEELVGEVREMQGAELNPRYHWPACLK
jgi:hypothetical protein